MRYSLIAAFLAGIQASTVLAAEPITLKLGGKLRHYFFVADQDNAPTDRIGRNGMFTDAELYFDGKTVLDNGVEVRGVIELEAETRNDRNADEVYIDFVSGLGKVRVGEKEGVNAAMIGEPTPEALLTTDEEIIGDVIRRRTGITTKDPFTFKRYANDVLGVSYETPAIIPGVKFGFTYHPQTSDLEGPFDKRLQEHDAIDVSGRYEGRFRGGTYRLAAGYFHSSSRIGGNDGNEAYTFHAGFTYGGWDFGGAYVKSEPASGIDEISWTVGVLYGIGPYKISAKHFSARRDTLPFEEKVESTNVQGAYRIGPGVTLGLTGFRTEQTDARGAKFDGLGALGGAKLAF